MEQEPIYTEWIIELARFVLALGDRLDYIFVKTDSRYSAFRVIPKRETPTLAPWEPFPGWQMAPEPIDNPIDIILNEWRFLVYDTCHSIWIGWSDRARFIVWCE